MFSTFPVGVSLEDGPGLSDMPGNAVPAPQLVMLANIAAAEGGGGADGSTADEKEMMELKTVGGSYSDSEDESVIRCPNTLAHGPTRPGTRGTGPWSHLVLNFSFMTSCQCQWILYFHVFLD